LRRLTVGIFVLLIAGQVRGSESVKILVFPLDGALKASNLAWLNEGIAISISQQLSGRTVKTIERNERVELVEKIDLPPSARLSRASMIRVAQKASADLLVMGTITGTEQNLKILLKVLDVKSLKLSGDIVANGPVGSLPQMENELAWLVLSNSSLERSSSREKFAEKMRKVPNSAFSFFVQSLNTTDESEQLHLLLRAVEVYRNFPEAQMQISHIYFHRGDCSSAIPHLLLVRGEEGAYRESEFIMGTCLLQGELPAQAIQTFTRMLSVTRSFEVLNNLGVAYLRRGEYPAALNAFIESRSFARADPVVALNLAITRHLQGNDSAARAGLEDVLKANPKNGMLHFVMGFLLKSIGENEKAATAFGKAKSLGVNVEKLQAEDAKGWARVITNWDQGN
jgi:tetratricopeptide (TPR) repeat protein